MSSATTSPAPAFAAPVAGAPITILASRLASPQPTTPEEQTFTTAVVSHAPQLIGVIGDSVAMSLGSRAGGPGVDARHLRGKRRDPRLRCD